MRYYDTTSVIQLPQKQSTKRLYANVTGNRQGQQKQKCKLSCRIEIIHYRFFHIIVENLF